MPADPRPDNAVSRHIRTHKQPIVERWYERVRAERPELERLDRASVIDHLPEVLDGLAGWIDGDMAGAGRAFETLAEGHALQRLGYGIDLDTLTAEYSILRSTLLHEVLSVAPHGDLREPLIRLSEAMDEAVNESVKRYAGRRDQVRDRFIGVLAHDLRSPLSTISTAAGWVVSQSAGPDDRLHKGASMILRSAERMSRMIHDVITFARGHLGGGIPVALRPGDLAELCREVVQELKVAHPHRDLELECRGDTRGYWDADRVLQAMSNLVGNALQHGADPLRVVVEETADRRAVRTRVTNRGAAIPQDRLGTLFDPFKDRGSEQHTGLGLGLYIVHAIALAHGARCVVASSEAEGTRFTIDWPRTPTEEVPNRA